MRIGELTMQELKKIDEVAYVRFASVDVYKRQPLLRAAAQLREGWFL